MHVVQHLLANRAFRRTQCILVLGIEGLLNVGEVKVVATVGREPS